jgi:hypothetical protein
VIKTAIDFVFRVDVSSVPDEEYYGLLFVTRNYGQLRKYRITLAAIHRCPYQLNGECCPGMTRAILARHE